MVSFSLLLIVTIISTFVILLSVNQTSAQTVSVSTDEAAYLPRDNIKISGYLYDGVGNPLNKKPVNITVFLSDDPSRVVYKSSVFTTNNGSYDDEGFRIRDNDPTSPNQQYTVSVMASIKESKV
jgi:hypothetical protein